MPQDELSLGVAMGFFTIGLAIGVAIGYLLSELKSKDKEEDLGYVFERDENGLIKGVYRVPALRKS